MTFNNDAQLDTSQVSVGGGGGGGLGGGGIAIGGGAGLLIMILGLVFGVDTSAITGSPGAPVEPGQQPVLTACKSGADANRDRDCRILATVNSVQAFWAAELPQYRKAQTIAYRGVTQSACGTASNQVGPFYCPVDKKVYIDSSFFDELTDKFGADDGALAQEYVVAHEYGHHVQDLLGLLDRAQQDPRGEKSGAVRIELMADCLGGMWAHGAATTKASNGKPFMQPLTRADINSALSAASAVGDDRIQQKVQGRVNPEAWTHGSSAMRQRWFTIGYERGDLKSCNTFAAGAL